MSAPCSPKRSARASGRSPSSKRHLTRTPVQSEAASQRRARSRSLLRCLPRRCWSCDRPWAACSAESPCPFAARQLAGSNAFGFQKRDRAPRKLGATTVVRARKLSKRAISAHPLFYVLRPAARDRSSWAGLPATFRPAPTECVTTAPALIMAPAPTVKMPSESLTMRAPTPIKRRLRRRRARRPSTRGRAS